jgi:G:T-mismatch repair DNA endonuclease (very short patch repair protein)
MEKIEPLIALYRRELHKLQEDGWKCWIVHENIFKETIDKLSEYENFKLHKVVYTTQKMIEIYFSI